MAKLSEVSAKFWAIKELFFKICIYNCFRDAYSCCCYSKLFSPYFSYLLHKDVSSGEDIAECRATYSNIYGRDITRVGGLAGTTTRSDFTLAVSSNRLEITFSRLSSLPNCKGSVAVEKDIVCSLSLDAGTVMVCSPFPRENGSLISAILGNAWFPWSVVAAAKSPPLR